MSDDHDKPSTNFDLRELMSLMTSAQAPSIYADGLIAAGICDGVMNLTLTAYRNSLLPNGAGTHADVVTVAHLRLTTGAAQQLLSLLGAQQIHAFADGDEIPQRSSGGRH